MEIGQAVLGWVLFIATKVPNSPWVLLLAMVPFLFGRVRHLASLGKWGLAAIHFLIALFILLLPILIIVMLYHSIGQINPGELLGFHMHYQSLTLPEWVYFSPSPLYFWHIWYWADVMQPSVFWLVTGILLFLAQAFYWNRLRRRCRVVPDGYRSRSAAPVDPIGAGWRRAAPVAYIWSIIMVLPLLGVFIPAFAESREAVHQYQRSLKSFQADLRRAGLDEVKYPYSYYSYFERSGRPGFGHTGIAGFYTWDSPRRIFAFYEKLAEDAGMDVRRGTRPAGDGTFKSLPVLVAIGEDDVLEVSPYLNRRNLWRITVCWYMCPDFDNYHEWGYILSEQ